jgi:hypothetical protein
MPFSNHTRYDTTETDGRGGGFGISAFTDKLAQVSASVATQDGVTTSNTESRTAARAVVLADHDGTLLQAIDLNSMDSDGWTWKPTTANATARKWFALAIESSESGVTQVRDRSGQGNHGTPVNLTTGSIVPGTVGQALRLTGVKRDHVIIGDKPALDINENLTVAAWVEVTDINPTGAAEGELS